MPSRTRISHARRAVRVARRPTFAIYTRRSVQPLPIDAPLARLLVPCKLARRTRFAGIGFGRGTCHVLVYFVFGARRAAGGPDSNCKRAPFACRAHNAVESVLARLALLAVPVLVPGIPNVAAGPARLAACGICAREITAVQRVVGAQQTPALPSEERKTASHTVLFVALLACVSTGACKVPVRPCALHALCTYGARIIYTPTLCLFRPARTPVELGVLVVKDQAALEGNVVNNASRRYKTLPDWARRAQGRVLAHPPVLARNFCAPGQAHAV